MPSHEEVLRLLTSVDPSITAWQASDHLQDDLGLDSLQLLQLALKLEALTGHRAPPELYASIQTVGDLVGWWGQWQRS